MQDVQEKKNNRTSTWGTHPPDDKKTWITGLDNHDMPKLKNGEKLPVAVLAVVITVSSM